MLITVNFPKILIVINQTFFLDNFKFVILLLKFIFCLLLKIGVFIFWNYG